MKPPVLDFFDFDSTPFWLSLRRTFSHASEEEVRLKISDEKNLKYPLAHPTSFLVYYPPVRLKRWMTVFDNRCLRRVP